MSSLKAEVERLFGEADRLARAGDRSGAIRCYRVMLEIDGLERDQPLAAECAHWGLAELAAQNSDLAMAETHLREAIRLNPEEAIYHEKLGVVHSHQSRLAEAADELEKSLKLRPNHPRTVHLLGWVLLRSGNRKRGRQLLERAIQLDDCDTEMLNDLAVCLAEDGKIDRALALLERAREIDPKSALLKSFREMIIERQKSKGAKKREPEP